MQINRFAFALLFTLVSTISAAEVTASKKVTRKTRKNNGITGYDAGWDDFDAALRSFHSTVDYATAMVGYTTACFDLSLDNGYNTVCSIMKALADPDPNEFLGILRNRFFENGMVSGRRLKGFWESIGNAFKCVGTVLGTGLSCTNPLSADICRVMLNNTKTNC